MVPRRVLCLPLLPPCELTSCSFLVLHPLRAFFPPQISQISQINGDGVIYHKGTKIRRRGRAFFTTEVMEVTEDRMNGLTRKNIKPPSLVLHFPPLPPCELTSCKVQALVSDEGSRERLRLSLLVIRAFSTNHSWK